MSHPVSNIVVFCTETVLGEKKEWGGVKTTTTHPTFRIEVEFGDSKSKKSFTCPYCNKEVKYQAYRFEFSLRKSLKWVAVVIGVSVLLFLIAFFLVVGGWDVERAMWYFGLWGVVGFIVGMGFLVGQVLRYLIFYRKNEFKYVFVIREWRNQHIMINNRKGATWREPPISAPER